MPINVFPTLAEIDETAFNVPGRKDFAAVNSISLARGEMYLVTSAPSHGVNAIHLFSLKQFFAKHLGTGQKVKLIFVVPPHRFPTFAEQKYLFPPRPPLPSFDNIARDGKQEQERPKPEKRKIGAAFEIHSWDNLPYGEGESMFDLAQILPDFYDPATKGKSKKDLEDEWKAALLDEVTDWVDQYVLEFRVNLMIAGAEKSVRKGLKKLSVLPFVSTSPKK
jgi:hypothetical protein